MTTVLVLGCGPAGLLAAHAASYVEGAKVVIVSAKRRSDLYGCQYLHSAIPGLRLARTEVSYELLGNVADYEAKVYGAPGAGGPVSPTLFSGRYPAWDIRQAYDLLWSRYEAKILDVQLSPEMIRPMIEYYEADLVVSSVPLPVLCQRPEEHSFSGITCWAMGDAPALGQRVPVPCPEDTVICDSTRDTGYYRVSRVFGHSTVEWPGHRHRPPIEGVVKFTKPLATTCTCWLGIGDTPDQRPVVHRVGRFGRWQKGILAHEAFNDTIKALSALAEKV